MGFRGYIVPRPGLGGPGVRGPERVQVSALSFGVAPCGVCMGLNFSEDLFNFFCPSTNFGQKFGLNFDEYLFFFSFFMFFFFLFFT